MNVILPSLNNAIKEKNILSIYEKNYQKIANPWFDLQIHWLGQSYEKFKDHDKYLILIYLVKRTFNEYSNNFITLNYNEFYSADKIEIEQFNIVELSKNLGISKETARRKISELEKDGSIQKNKKKLSVKKNAFKHNRPENSIKRIVSFLSSFSKLCIQENVLNNALSKDQIENIMIKKFSYSWKLWYEMLIPNLVMWKKKLNDLESFHIYAQVATNESFEMVKYLKKNKVNESASRIEFIEYVKEIQEKIGINAMSISNLSGIPRATVIRKLKILTEKEFIIIDEKKLYKINPQNTKFIKEASSEAIGRLAKLTTQIFNLVKFS